MNKALRILPLLTIAIGISNSIFSQNTSILEQTNREKLNELADQWRRESEDRLPEAIRIAKERGIQTFAVSETGEIIEIRGLEEGSRLIFNQTGNRDAARTISTDDVYPGGSLGLSLTGDSMTIGEWDGGAVRTSHYELVGRVTQVDAASSQVDHATHVAGTIMGMGVDTSARGMAYQANLDAYDWNSDNSEMATAAGNGLLISSHSYGSITGWRYNSGLSQWEWWGDTTLSGTEDYRFGFYNSAAQAWDQIARNAPYYLIVKSAGNDRGEGTTGPHYLAQHGVWSSTARLDDGGATGYDCISSYTGAKNILTVGAVDAIPGGYSSPSSVVMSSFSGWGPTDDGRIKPDVVANGVGVYSCLATNDSAYASWNGTAMATPSASGSLLLVQQHHKEEKGNFMKAATLKALAIHTADEAGPSVGPDYQHGWGLLNIAKAVEHISDTSGSRDIVETSVANSSSYSFSFTSNGLSPIRATICWTDIAGTPVSASVDPTNAMLVNDLDLRVFRDSDSTEFEPYILNPASPSSAATTGDNFRDNVEMVYISLPDSGSYTVVVTHKGTLSGGSSQDFSLILDGGNIPPPPPIPLVCNVIVDSFPNIQNFDGYANCNTTSASACVIPGNTGYVNDTLDDIDWKIKSFSTPSTITGPSGDSSISGNGKFIYTEASTNNTGYPNKRAVLYTPCFNLDTLIEPELYFAYHMYGTNMGSLAVEILHNGSWTQIFSLVGEQGDKWLPAVVDLSSYAGDTIQLRFIGTTGNGFRSDMALDDIQVREKDYCPDPQFLTVSNIDSTSAVVSWSSLATTWRVRLYRWWDNALVLDQYIPWNPVLISGLDPNTTYRVYVQDSCSNGDTSAWINSYFTTKCVRDRHDSLPDAKLITSLPYNDTGSTENGCYTNQFPARSPADIFYKLPVDSTMHSINVSLCGSDSAFNTYLFVLDDSQNIIASNNFYCGVHSQVDSVNVSGMDTVYIVVDGFQTEFGEGSYNLNVWANTALQNPSACGANLYITQDTVCTFGNVFPITVSAPGDSMGTDVFLNEVKLIIEHYYVADLAILLESPSHDTVGLSYFNGGMGNHYGNPFDVSCNQATIFGRDSAFPLLSFSSAPYLGFHLPEESLENFDNNTDPNGTWNLLICDSYPIDSGFLQHVELVFDTVESPSKCEFGPVIIGIDDSDEFLCPGSDEAYLGVYGLMPQHYSFQWYKNGIPLTAADTFSSYDATTEGLFNVIVTDSNSCSDSAFFGIQTYEVLPPHVTINVLGNDTICDGDSVTLRTISGSDYQWMINGSWENGANNREFVVYQPGLYNVLVEDSIECKDSAALATQIWVDMIPVVNVSVVGDSVICEGEHAILTTKGGVSYQWYRDSIPLPGATSDTLITSDSGAYYAIGYSASGCAGFSVRAQNIVVNPLPNVSVIDGGTTPFCAGDSGVILTSAIGVQYQWFRDGTLLPGDSIFYLSVLQEGNYNVEVTTTEGCSDTSVVPFQVVVNDLPVASFTNTGASNICVGDSTLLTTTWSESMQWTRNGLILPGDTGNMYVVNDSGLYNLQITDSNGCSDIATGTYISLNDLPVVNVTTGGSTSFCDGDSVQLTSTLGSSYQWYHNGSMLAGETAQTLYARGQGNYNVVMTNTDNCSDSAMTSVSTTLFPLPVVTITTFDSSFCPGDSAVMATSTNFNSYQWYRSGVPILNAQLYYTSSRYSGIHNVLVTDTNGCSDSSAIGTQIIALPIPSVTITAGGPTTFCEGSSVMLNSTNAASYGWTRNSSFILGATSSSYQADSSGFYRVTIIDSNGCTGFSNSISVSVNPLPNVSITAGGATSFCQGDSVSLSTISGSSYQWYQNGILMTGATSASHFAKNSGLFNVVVTDANSCSDSAALGTQVTVHNLPAVTIIPVGPTSFCDGDSTALGTSGVGMSHQWYRNGVLIPGATNSTLFPKTAGNYNVIQTNANTCSDSASSGIVLNVFSLPTFSISSSKTAFCDGDSATISGPSASSYQWYEGGNILNGETNQNLIVTAQGIYNLQITDNNNCSDTASSSISITVFDLPIVSIDTLPTLCHNSPGISLTQGSPQSASHGLYKGVGVAGVPGSYTFDPSVSGVGVFDITYVYTDSNTCVDSATNPITVNNCIGIEENESGRMVSFYPNPTNGILYIQLDGEVNSDMRMTISDASGQIVMKSNIRDLRNGNLISIDLQHLAKGIYFVQLYAEEQMWHQKVLLE